MNHPCFVCRVEDTLGQVRGTQSHPLNCEWRVREEHKIRTMALEKIQNLIQSLRASGANELYSEIDEIGNLAISALVHKTYLKEGE